MHTEDYLKKNAYIYIYASRKRDAHTCREKVTIRRNKNRLYTCMSNTLFLAIVSLPNKYRPAIAYPAGRPVGASYTLPFLCLLPSRLQPYKHGSILF